MAELLPVWTRVKAVTGKASDDVGGDKVLAAVSTRIAHSTRFSEYSSFKFPNRVVPLDAAIEVDRHCLKQGKPARHLDLVASELGMVAVALPSVALHGTKLGKLTGQAMKECADVFTRLGDMLEDERITADELPDFDREVEEAIRKLVKLQMQVRAEAVEDE